MINKCYITARYKLHINDFIIVTIQDADFILYIGNFKNTDKIIAKIERDMYINAICRIRQVYEPKYPQFNKRLDKCIQPYFDNSMLPYANWLEAIKLTTLPEAKIYPIEEKSYFTLEAKYALIAQLIKNAKPVTVDNQDKLVTVHGALTHSHTLTIYRVLKVEGDVVIKQPEEKLTNISNLPKELQKFNI